MRATKLLISSAVVLFILSILPAIIVYLIFSVAGNSQIDVYLFIVGTIVFGFFAWLWGPWFTELIMRWLYKAQVIDQASLAARFPEQAAYLKAISLQHRIPNPKFIYIDDDNPTAFTFGSGAFNARLVLTKGLWTYLQKDELEAVMAHEVGHIVHRDFIVMSVANTLLTVLYEIYYVTTKGKRSGSGGKGSGMVALIGLASYVLYQLGFYVVLYLNRVRESYADFFSAEVTKEPDALARALVKIAYGIVSREEQAKEDRLIQSTKTMGIMGFKTAKSAGLVVRAAQTDKPKAARAFLYDIVNPWAKLAQLVSTHPLTGVRINNMAKLSKTFGQKPTYDLETVKATVEYDHGKMWRGFWFGLFVWLLPWTCLLLIIPFGGFWALTEGVNGVYVGVAAMALAGLAFLIRAIYRYPGGSAPRPTTVLDLMSDLQASPVRGIRADTKGTVVGRGQAGFVFSEDMLMQDETGLIYLDYTSPWGGLGNLFFGYARVKKIIGQDVESSGWFLRSNVQRLALKSVTTKHRKFRSYTKFWAVLGAIIVLGLAISLGYAARRNSFKTQPIVTKDSPVLLYKYFLHISEYTENLNQARLSFDQQDYRAAAASAVKAYHSAVFDEQKNTAASWIGASYMRLAMNTNDPARVHAIVQEALTQPESTEYKTKFENILNGDYSELGGKRNKQLDQAAQYYEAGNVAGALSTATRLVNTQSTYLPKADLAEAYYYIGWANLKQGNLAVAISSADHASALDPTYAVPYALLAEVDLVRANPAQAVRDANMAISRDPNMGFAYWLKGIALSEQQNFPDATVAMQQAVNLTPAEAGYKADLANIQKGVIIEFTKVP